MVHTPAQCVNLAHVRERMCVGLRTTYQPPINHPHNASPGTLWVDTAQRRYAPAKGDPVVGVITERYAENYHVHIHAAFPAQLPALAFEGATRRNKPNLQVHHY